MERFALSEKGATRYSRRLVDVTKSYSSVGEPAMRRKDHDISEVER
jgi:hypothetical protein